uniref:Uncharacterized protein n=1 Tax=Anguilla anguilla TaxID=7936 RepID=A0A0E9T4Q0_ANGAN
MAEGAPLKQGSAGSTSVSTEYFRLIVFLHFYSLPPDLGLLSPNQ